MLPSRVKFIEAAPITVRHVLTQAYGKNCSPRAAIKAKCLDCCHWDRKEIKHCTVVLCPLHSFRPFQPKA